LNGASAQDSGRQVQSCPVGCHTQIEGDEMNARFKAYHTSWSRDWLAEFEYAGYGLPNAVGFR
jgi:hypothetical protein